MRQSVIHFRTINPSSLGLPFIPSKCVKRRTDIHEEGKGWNEKNFLKGIYAPISSECVIKQAASIHTVRGMECIFCSKSAKLIREICSLSRNVLFSSKHNWKTDAAVQWILPEFSSFENNAARCSRSRAFQNGCMRRDRTRKTGGVPCTRNGRRFVRPQITTKIGSVLANRSWLIMLFIIQLHKVEYS